jgi:hypothetical protein
MTKKWFLATLGAALVVCMLVPASALAASSKVTAGLRGLTRVYTVHGATGSTTISGKLVYRRTTVSGRRRVKVDAPLKGHVYLYREDDRTGDWVKVGFSNAPRGAFSFSVKSGGYYRVRYIGDKRHTSAQTYLMVEEDLLSVQNLKGLRASTETSGDLFVTVSADFGAPAGYLTTSTPGLGIFVVLDGDGNPLGPLIGPGVIQSAAVPSVPVVSPDPLGGIRNGFLVAVRRSGTLRYGFDVPAADADHTFTVISLLMGTGQFVAPASAVATFTPSALLP